VSIAAKLKSRTSSFTLETFDLRKFFDFLGFPNVALVKSSFERLTDVDAGAPAPAERECRFEHIETSPRLNRFKSLKVREMHVSNSHRLRTVALNCDHW
jgi:hypothetical protein